MASKTTTTEKSTAAASTAYRARRSRGRRAHVEFEGNATTDPGFADHDEEARGDFAPRRAAAAVASLNRWRGMLRRAKRRRSSGSVSKSASTKISTISSLEKISTRMGASAKSTS